MRQTPSYKLHSRTTLIFLFTAMGFTILYVVFIVSIVNKLEDTMVATLISHEIDELVGDLSVNPDIAMPKTASVSAFMLSRQDQKPIPDYLKDLSPNVYNGIKVGDKIFEAAIFDFANDRIYIEFDITEVSQYRSLLLYALIGGGIFAALILLVSGIWVFKKFLSPVTELAEEVAGINPDERNVRIEAKYRDYEVGLIAHSFDQFMDRLDDFVEREQSFTAAISHELRTPISVVSTAVDLLELKGVSRGQQGAIDRIKSSTSYMAKVIESLLYFARDTHDDLEKTIPEINLNEVFLNILKQYEPIAMEKNIALLFKSKFSLSVRMSENHLEIVLGNLVRNAIANTTEGGVKVILKADGFSVDDTGQGIDPNEIDLIVTRNYHSKDSHGSGLGLYLVQNICTIYGLDLNIKSSQGEGSSFSITFPDMLLIK